MGVKFVNIFGLNQLKKVGSVQDKIVGFLEKLDWSKKAESIQEKSEDFLKKLDRSKKNWIGSG